MFGIKVTLPGLGEATTSETTLVVAYTTRTLPLLCAWQRVSPTLRVTGVDVMNQLLLLSSASSLGSAERNSLLRITPQYLPMIHLGDSELLFDPRELVLNPDNTAPEKLPTPIVFKASAPDEVPHILSNNQWGTLAYPEKIRNKIRKFQAVPGLFTVGYVSQGAESPMDAIQAQGLVVRDIDTTANIALVESAEMKAAASGTKNESALVGVEHFIRLLANEETESTIRAILPVVLDENDVQHAFVPPEFLIKILTQSTHAAIPTSHQSILDLLAKKQVTILGEVSPFLFHCKMTTSDKYFETLQEISNEIIVEYAEPIYITFRPDTAVGLPATHANAERNIQWNLERIDCGVAWSTELGNERVVVAVLDKGIDVDNAGLKDQLYPRGSDIWNYVHPELPSPDEKTQQHGTEVAGIIASAHNGGSVLGIAPHCKLMPLKLYTISLNTEKLRSALQYVRQHAENHSENRYVVNMSFFVADTMSVEQEIKKGIEQKIIYVASAGNDARKGVPHFPSDYTGVLSIAAVDKDDTLTAYSNYGPNVDLCAPGGSGDITQPSTNIVVSQSRDRVGVDFGTSFAAPHVTGVVALILSKAIRLGKTLSMDEVVSIIKDSADSIQTANPSPTLSGMLGSGRINAAKSLDRM